MAAEAPPWLVAHLRLVRDSARLITDWLCDEYPGVPIDVDSVLFGAVTHKIGKVRHPEELSAPGSSNEEAGRSLLIRSGVSPERARFAQTHANWNATSATSATLDDRVVSLADKIWKGSRTEDLEALVVADLAAATGLQPRRVFLNLDDLLSRLADDSVDRLAFQFRFST